MFTNKSNLDSFIINAYVNTTLSYTFVEEMTRSVPLENSKDQKGAKKPWAKLDEKKSHWKITFSVFAKRSYSFYIWSTILPLVNKHTTS